MWPGVREAAEDVASPWQPVERVGGAWRGSAFYHLGGGHHTRSIIRAKMKLQSTGYVRVEEVLTFWFASMLMSEVGHLSLRAGSRPAKVPSLHETLALDFLCQKIKDT